MDSHLEVEARARALGQALACLELTLDWTALGEFYCSEGGADFFCEEQRQELIESGLTFAQELGERLGPAKNARSLYLGAALFEIFPALFEHLVLEREVVLLNLDHPETRELNRGLAHVSRDLELALPTIRVHEVEQLGGQRFDHIWMTSVLNDPDAFPALHDALYQRDSGDEYATCRGNLVEDKARASSLLESLLAASEDACWFTTTDEELPLVQKVCEAHGRQLAIPESARLSAIVGDPVRHCRLIRA